MRFSIKAFGILIACGALLPIGAQAQQGSGVRYQVTSKMEMVGVPFAMPARTDEVCGPKHAAGESMVPKQDNCTVHDYRLSGSKATFRMVCTGKDAMTGTGEFEMLGANGYRGKMTAETEGQQMIMSFEGKRVGDCDYAKEGPQAKANQMMAKSCDGMLKESGPALLSLGKQFTAPGAMCLPQKAAYCSKVTPLAGDLKAIRDTEAMEVGIRKQGVAMPGQWDTFEGCGMSRASILAKDCSKAESIKDYEFIGALCPDRLAATCDRADPLKDSEFLIGKCPARAGQIAAQQCAGRDYTALSTSPYRDFCNGFAGARLDERNGNGAGDDQATPAKPEQTPPKKPSFKDRMKSITNGVIGGG